jgi:3-phenylpropionate/cinnamic acid dioxygenase small subunit
MMFKRVWVQTAAVMTVALAAASPAMASQADDQMAIQQVLNRYAYALDGRDAESYVRTFAPDGVLDYARGELQGRNALRDMVMGLRTREQQARAESTLRPSRGRHFLTNIVIEVNGDTATAKDYWVAFNNNNPERKSQLGGFGHAENELKRINGEWLIARRVIFNEQVPERAAADDNASFLAPR